MSAYTMNCKKTLQTSIPNRKIGYNGIFFLVYTFFVLIIYIMPFFKFIVPYKLAAAIMLLSLPVLAFYDDRGFKFSIALILISLFMMVQNVIVGMNSVDAINECIRNIRFFLPALWGYFFLCECNNKKFNIFFFAMFLIMIGFILFKTMDALRQDPMIARILAQDKSTSSNNVNTYRLSNIGGFEFSYMMGILALCFLWIFVVSKKIILKIINIVLYILSFYYILQSQYMTLLILTFAGSILLLFLCKKNLAFRIVIVLLGVLIVFNMVNILTTLGSFFKGGLLGTKFEQIAKSLETNNSKELGRRPELLMEGLRAWINSPIWGSFDSGLNAHSFFISVLAQSGIIGISLIGYLFISAVKLIYSQIRQYEKGRPLFFCTILFLVLLSVLNPIGYVFEVVITVFFITLTVIKLFVGSD